MSKASFALPAVNGRWEFHGRPPEQGVRQMVPPSNPTYEKALTTGQRLRQYVPFSKLIMVDIVENSIMLILREVNDTN